MAIVVGKMVGIRKKLAKIGRIYKESVKLVATDNKGFNTLAGWAIGIVIALILIGYVAIPVAVDTVNYIQGCLTGPAATIAGIIPLGLVLVLLLAVFGYKALR